MTPPGSGQHACTGPLGLGVEGYVVAGSLGNRGPDHSMDKKKQKGCSMNQYDWRRMQTSHTTTCRAAATSGLQIEEAEE